MRWWCRELWLILGNHQHTSTLPKNSSPRKKLWGSFGSSCLSPFDKRQAAHFAEWLVQRPSCCGYLLFRICWGVPARSVTFIVTFLLSPWSYWRQKKNGDRKKKIDSNSDTNLHVPIKHLLHHSPNPIPPVLFSLWSHHTISVPNASSHSFILVSNMWVATKYCQFYSKCLTNPTSLCSSSSPTLIRSLSSLAYMITIASCCFVCFKSLPFSRAFFKLPLPPVKSQKITSDDVISLFE